MKPRVWVFTICRNEARMMPFFLRHYSTFAEKIVVYDEQSDDGTREILQRSPIVELREWPNKGLNDEKFIECVNSTVGDCDWIIFADVDELLYHPDILRVLEEAKEDMIRATGYALISERGFPHHSAPQIYRYVRTGIRQPNYDKLICWRSGVRVFHTIGRHTYDDWPKCSGVRGSESKLKLLHCHHIGGVEWTRQRNKRNYDMAVDKKFAWNYAPQLDKPDQVGTVAWVRDAIENKKLIDVMAIPDYGVKKTTLRKLQFGCGGNHLDGWENHDAEINITNPLPFSDGCASFIFAEHVIEHVTHRQAWLFLAECWRVLAPGGVVRIAIPDISRMSSHMTQEYADAVKSGGHGDGSFGSAIKAAVFEHGHQAAWDENLLASFLEAIGFKPLYTRSCGESDYPELRNIEGHGKVVGDEIARVETSIVEGVKP